MMLEIRNLRKHFNGVQAVVDLSVRLESKRITSLIGPNGAGKSTVFNIVTGFLQQEAGSISFQDHAIDSFSANQRARLGIARTFQNLRLFRKLSVLENLLLARQDIHGERLMNALLVFNSHSSGYRAHVAQAESILEFVGLQQHRDALADNLSYGQQKLLSLGCCLSMEAPLLLLDEPVAGVQPEMVEKIKSLLRVLVERNGKTIFLIEHNLDMVMEISNRIIVMDDGKKIADGNPEEIASDSSILEAYLS